MNEFPGVLRVASYNIFKARWFEPQANGASRGAVLADLDAFPTLRGADVLALQEAIVGPLGRPAQRRDTVAEIAARIGIEPHGAGRHWSFHGARLGPEREWGVALVTRPPAEFHPVRLPKQFWSPWQRSAVLAEVGPWLVASLHLEVWPLVGAASRRAQIRAVLDAVDRLDAGRDRPVVLAGDFNCQPGGGPHADLRRHGFALAHPERGRTFGLGPLGMLGLHLDHIYVRGARVREAGIESRARGSDHQPVWAVLEA
jgi:endonuclease/exonuclease/phosphatase family metal-dependent hydrolase